MGADEVDPLLLGEWTKFEQSGYDYASLIKPYSVMKPTGGANETVVDCNVSLESDVSARLTSQLNLQWSPIK